MRALVLLSLIILAGCAEPDTTVPQLVDENADYSAQITPEPELKANGCIFELQQGDTYKLSCTNADSPLAVYRQRISIAYYLGIDRFHWKVKDLRLPTGQFINRKTIDIASRKWSAAMSYTYKPEHISDSLKMALWFYYIEPLNLEDEPLCIFLGNLIEISKNTRVYLDINDDLEIKILNPANSDQNLVKFKNAVEELINNSNINHPIIDQIKAALGST